MANETKVGVAVFAALVGVFGFVLHDKYEDKLTALAALHEANDPAEPKDAADDPLAEKPDAGLGAVTDAGNTGDLADFSDAFGPEPGAEPTGGVPLADAASPAAAPTDVDLWGAEPGAESGAAVEFVALEEPAPKQPADSAVAVDWSTGSFAAADPKPAAPPAKPVAMAAADDPFAAELDSFDAAPATTEPTAPKSAATAAATVEFVAEEPAAEPTTLADTDGFELDAMEPAPASAAADDDWPADMAPAAATLAANTADQAPPADPPSPEDAAMELWGAADEPAAVAATPTPAAADPLFPDDSAVAAEASLADAANDPAPALEAAEPVMLSFDEPAPLDEPATLDEPAATEGAVAFDANAAPAMADEGEFFLAAEEPAAAAPKSPAPKNPAPKSPAPKTAAPVAADAFADAETFEDADMFAAEEPLLADKPAADADIFMAAETPAAPVAPKPAPAAEEAALLWNLDDPAPAASVAAASPKPAAPTPALDANPDADFFLDANEPAAAPATNMAPVELADAPPATPPADVPAAAPMNEWPDLNSPPAAEAAPKPNPAANLAADEPDDGLTPVNFAPEINTRNPNLPPTRPVHNADAQTPSPLRFSGPDDRQVVEVQDGESYWTISKRAYGAAKYFKALARYNALRIRDPRNLKPGMKVICPPPSVLLAYDTDLADAERASESPGSNPGWSGYGVDDKGRPVYMVGPGDTLGDIAHKHLGRFSRQEEILALNRDKIRDPRRLKIGVLLNLPPDAAGVRRRVEDAMR
ncbi:LysM peptidoglycan-binding domain-containing protein [Alienimonas californiensis]|uniref:LysM domain/BON superfamily protein n=1 Tax=Alienimonas californiensis TaxID=2527989 RepID=A0A517PCP8_9PLAN|nr:LysM domain-containing protein [Alienimonas californiensis]QDT17154.1 LysM domain/BON superfamily protein [Alienimonas californiensis]